jgi:hypothetical protein
MFIASSDAFVFVLESFCSIGLIISVVGELSFNWPLSINMKIALNNLPTGRICRLEPQWKECVGRVSFTSLKYFARNQNGSADF